MKGAELVTSVLLLASAALFNASCSSSHKGSDGSKSLGTGGSSGTGARGGTTSTGAGGTGGSSTGGSSTGGTGTIVVTGGTSNVGDSGAAGDGSGATGATCGQDRHPATAIPLDIYVMLDRSSSMLDQVSGSTKWDAIRGALTTFIADPASNGIGIGLQFFPLHDPNVPNTCNTSTDCGTDNLCLKNFCLNAGPKFYICDTNADCMANGENYGPCTPLTYCWSSHGSQLCHSDALECNNVRGDCVPFNVCSGNKSYSCPEAGQRCVTDDGQDLGTCGPADSVCQHTSDCSTSAYAAPAAEVATLPGAATKLQSVLTATMPDGDTPTAPALAGAINHAKSWAMAHPDHKVVVLLATDGLPSDCQANATDADPYDIAGVAATAAAGLSGTPSIKTFVIGVFAPMDTDSQTNLNQIAKAGGGNNTAYIVNTGSANVETDFLNALDEIRGATVPCEFQIPKPSSGTFDPDLVNVVFTTDGKDQTLYYVADAGSCDATSGGWYYDDAKTPTKIIACPASCAEFKNATEVDINLGCKALVK